MGKHFEHLVAQFRKELEELLSTEFTIQCVDEVVQLKSTQFTTQFFLYPNQVSERKFNLQTIHIDEIDLKTQFPLIIKRITVLLSNNRKIFARKTIVARIDKKTP